MAEDKFSLHVDSDWKKQAQEEKKRLAEQEAARKQKEQQQAPAPAGVIATGAPGARAAAPGGRPAGGRAAPGQEETPQADFPSLVQSLVTQGGRILSLKKVEPTLEDVFIELVGHGLADEEQPSPQS